KLAGTQTRCLKQARKRPCKCLAGRVEGLEDLLARTALHIGRELSCIEAERDLVNALERGVDLRHATASCAALKGGDLRTKARRRLLEGFMVTRHCSTACCLQHHCRLLKHSACPFKNLRARRVVGGGAGCSVGGGDDVARHGGDELGCG